MLSKKDWQAIDKEAEAYRALCFQAQRDKDEAQAEIARLQAEVEQWKAANEANKQVAADAVQASMERGIRIGDLEEERDQWKVMATELGDKLRRADNAIHLEGFLGNTFVDGVEEALAKLDAILKSEATT